MAMKQEAVKNSVAWQRKKRKEKNENLDKNFQLPDVKDVDEIENDPKADICKKVIDRYGKDTKNWQRCDEQRVTYYKCWVADPIDLKKVATAQEATDAGFISGVNDDTYNTMRFYGEYHLHHKNHDYADKIRIFTAEPPIQAYAHYQSTIQPCYPQARGPRPKYIGHVDVQIRKLEDSAIKDLRPRAMVGHYNKYQYYDSYEAQKSYAAETINPDFYDEFSMVSSSEANLFAYGVLFLSTLCIVCSVCLIMVIASFFCGRWSHRWVKKGKDYNHSRQSLSE